MLATLLKLALLHGHFVRFLNCTNGINSRNAPYLCLNQRRDIEYKTTIFSCSVLQYCNFIGTQVILKKLSKYCIFIGIGIGIILEPKSWEFEHWRRYFLCLNAYWKEFSKSAVRFHNKDDQKFTANNIGHVFHVA